MSASRRILLVEDSSTMRRMLSTLLQDEGYEVALAKDGKEGLAKAHELPLVDLILTDFEMPELNGAGLCGALKADVDLRSIPVLLLTTLCETENKVLGLDSGADDYIQKPKSPEEIKELFARIRAHLRISDLRSELAERNRLLEAAHKKLSFELDLARKVQQAMMPRPPQPRGVLQVAVRYTPANQLGGDIYDFYRLDKMRLGILVADVSGHGVNSAMLSGMVKTLAAPLSIAVMEPGELLAGLDVAGEQFFPEGYFCTGFYLIADEETGLLRYAGVGHPPAIIVGPNGPRLLISNPGMLGIGMVDGTAGNSDRLAPGESLIMYTDGLTDAMDPSDVLFGEQRLTTVLQAHHGADPLEILNQVDQAVAIHTSPGRASDDINIIVLQHPVG
ncbi:PP2C family protein-serine/threonine phosphatase [Singulisphaera acidiphila]|uniref:Serine phosphatase RsbU, regulator of sigma subunit n=1 Tax=Singulisphaera acidiphila (strain ATCC BAA-1392 / DSM 18658 / VKM B-2454 / MOB10) TaxID=886293 RepID=L0D951_SINAD|nr:SpoIIE family protein phosphatase [Singulisphaera acidiphila]AGA25186.1 serine phosphatase RsbU, regulator of sigma subunit [Singulisphaera acidiphila DSM 18658]